MTVKDTFDKAKDKTGQYAREHNPFKLNTTNLELVAYRDQIKEKIESFEKAPTWKGQRKSAGKAILKNLDEVLYQVQKSEKLMNSDKLTPEAKKICDDHIAKIETFLGDSHEKDIDQNGKKVKKEISFATFPHKMAKEVEGHVKDFHKDLKAEDPNLGVHVDADLQNREWAYRDYAIQGSKMLIPFAVATGIGMATGGIGASVGWSVTTALTTAAPNAALSVKNLVQGKPGKAFKHAALAGTVLTSSMALGGAIGGDGEVFTQSLEKLEPSF